MSTPQTDSGLWIRNYAPAAENAPRLVCLPHAGGSASFFHPVATALAPAVEVSAVQYPGRQDRRHEPCIPTVLGLATELHRLVLPLADRPLALFGHSMGASVAFELARLLEQDGVTPVHLFASGRRAPSRHRAESVHRKDDDGLLADVRALSGTDSRVLGDDELLRMALPAIRNDYRAAETYEYRPGPPLRCPITALTGSDDPKADVDEVRAWQEHTAGRFELIVYPGGHFFLAAHQAKVLAAITAVLAAPTPAD